MTTTISPGGKTSLGGAVTVSEKKPLDDDTRETRVLEIEKLFDAADPNKRGYLDRCTSIRRHSSVYHPHLYGTACAHAWSV